MVSSRVALKYLRSCVPALGLIALAAMFLKLPEISRLFQCATCGFHDPYIPLISCGYFAALTALSLLFPAFPNRYIAWGGLVWALLLFFVMTWYQLPHWCFLCLLGHGCNLLIWGIWCFVPAPKQEATIPYPGMRLCLLFFVPGSIVALFGSLNLTFMAYGFKAGPQFSSGLRVGDSVPMFTVQTHAGRTIPDGDGQRMILNFMMPECPYCEELFQKLHPFTEQLVNSSCRIIHISEQLSPEMIEHSPLCEWVEDREGVMQKLFGIQGFPTLYVVGSDGRILRVISGVSDRLKEDLFQSLDMIPPQK